MDNKDKKKFAFDVGWVLAASIITTGILLIRKAFLAQYLGPENLGLFTMCLVIADIFCLFAGFGFEEAIVKYVAEFKENKEKIAQITSAAILTMLFFGFLSSIFLFTLSDFLAKIFGMPSLTSLLRIFSITFPFTLTITIAFGFFNGLREMNYFSYTVVSRTMLIFIAIVIFILMGWGVTGAITGYLIGEITIAILLLFFIIRYINMTTVNYKSSIKKLVSFGGKILGANVIDRVNNQIDILLIGFFLSAADVGYYSVAAALRRFIFIIPQSLRKITYPAASEFWARNQLEMLQKMIDKSMKYAACVLLPVGFGVGYFADSIITLAFGEKFISAVLPFLVLLLGTMIMGVAVRPIGGILPAIGRPDLETKKVTVCTLFYVLLNIVLIPAFGILGAAIAVTSSCALEATLHLYLTLKYTKIKIEFRWFGKIGLILLILILFSGSIRQFNYYLGSIVILAFPFLIWFYFLTDEDRKYFSDILDTIKLYIFPRP